MRRLRVTGNRSFDWSLLVVSTGDVHGAVPKSFQPIAEDRLPEPRSRGAASELAAEVLCAQSTATERVPMVIARLFHHIGPGAERSNLDRRLRPPADGGPTRGKGAPVLEVGDLEVTRDFTDVRGAEQRRAVRDARKLHEATGGKTTTPLDDLLAAKCAAARAGR